MGIVDESKILEAPKRKVIRENVDRAILLCQVYRKGLDLVDDLLRGLEQILTSFGSKEDNMEQLTGEVQEYWRRQMVALIRGAGTSIRKEEVKRQALSARVNLKEAARLRQELLDDCKALLPTEVLEKMQGATAEEISKYLSDYLQKIMLSIVAVPAQLSRVQAHFQTLNDLVSMVNRIIQDLSNEGIYLVPVQGVPMPPDILSAVFSLPRALENASRVLGILEGVAQAAEE